MKLRAARAPGPSACPPHLVQLLGRFCIAAGLILGRPLPQLGLSLYLSRNPFFPGSCCLRMKKANVCGKKRLWFRRPAEHREAGCGLPRKAWLLLPAPGERTACASSQSVWGCEERTLASHHACSKAEYDVKTLIGKKTWTLDAAQGGLSLLRTLIYKDPDPARPV
jgi:hypothetical protein